MPRSPRHYTNYPDAYLTLAKIVATASLPALRGPFAREDAFTYRHNFYRWREVLRVSVQTLDDPVNSYPARLYEMLETLSVKIRPASDHPGQFNVIFDTDPIIKDMSDLDPAAAQARQLSRAQFIAAQRPSPMSTPMFTSVEMQERLDDISKG